MKLVLSKSKKVTKPKFQKKNFFGPNFGKLGPNLPKFEVFGQLFKFESLNISDFAYFNRQAWFLNDNGGRVAEKKFPVKFGPRLDFSPNYFTVSKFIFSIATHQNFFILHIMIDNNDILQIQVVSGGKKN